MNAEENNTDNQPVRILDVRIAVGIALIIGVILILIAYYYNNGKETWSLLLCGIFGLTLGWGMGIIATPYSASEGKKLSEIRGVAYSFLTGYGISKIDPLFNSLTEEKIVFVVYTATTLLCAFIVTYVNRVYWLSGIAKQGNSLKKE